MAAGETPRQALGREITEELGIVLEAGDREPAFPAEGGAGDRRATGRPAPLHRPHWSETIAPIEGQARGWHDPAQAALLALAPMAGALLTRLA